MSELRQDLRFALRMLRSGWKVTAIAIVSLAVAIGGNTAVFGLIKTFLFQPLTVEEPERLVILQERPEAQPTGMASLSTSLPMQADLAERSRTTSGWTGLRPLIMGLRVEGTAEPINAAQVATSFFGVTGARVERGREFLPEEGVPGARRVAIVAAEFWERMRGEELDPLGEELTLNGESYEVVGVLPAGFSFMFSTAGVWVPMTDVPSESPRDRRDIMTVARLAPQATMDQVRMEMSALGASIAEEYPNVQQGWALDVFNARNEIPDTRTKMFYGLLQGSVFFVLLIACGNVTNLLLARAQERRREIALRTVLGAGRGRLARQLFTESSLLVVVGATLGLGLGWLGIRLLATQFSGSLPANFTPQLDTAVVLFTVGLSAVAGIVFGLAPVLQALRRDQAQAIREGGARASNGRRRKLVTRGLVVVEIALSLVALGGGAMLVRGFLEIQRADPGFDGSSLMTARIRVPESKYPDEDQRLLLLDRVLEEASGLQGARSAALVNTLPRGFQVPSDTFHVAGDEWGGTTPPPRAVTVKASPGYLDALGIALIRGRFFDDTDRLGAAPVAAVNRSFVTRWFPDEDPIGRFVEFEGASRQIVGVVEDVQQVLVRTPGQVDSEVIYVPAAQSPMGIYQAVVSASGDPLDLKEPLRAALQSLDPDLTLSRVLTMDEVMEQFFAGFRVFNSILGGFGVLAILLASLGTYGVLAYDVTQRRHEIGIRRAVGAPGKEVVRMITRQGVWLATLGLALGGLVLVPLTGLLRTLLEGFSTVNGNTAFAIAAILFAVTVAASLVPAVRASGLDPVQALREE